MNDKQSIVKEIFKKLNITVSPTDFSEGSTVTKSSLVKILNKIAKNLDEKKKQKIFEAICILLDISLEKQFLSSGGTVTKKGYKKILSVLSK